MFDHHHPHPHVHVLRLRGNRAIRRVVAGTALILFGSAWMLRNQGLITGEQLWLVGPVALALGGLAHIAFARHALGRVRGAMALLLAAYFALVIEHVGGLDFATSWPVMLILLGLASIARAVFGRRDDTCEEPNW